MTAVEERTEKKQKGFSAIYWRVYCVMGMMIIILAPIFLLVIRSILVQTDPSVLATDVKRLIVAFGLMFTLMQIGVGSCLICGGILLSRSERTHKKVEQIAEK